MNHAPRICIFWAFPFKRINGTLGSVPTNHQSIEIQLMRKFYSNQQILQALNSNRQPALEELFLSLKDSVGSFKYEQLSELSLSNPEITDKACKFIPPTKESCLSSDEHRDIETTLKVCFGVSYVCTLMLYKYAKAILLEGHLHGSINSMHHNSCLVHANVTPGLVKKYLMVITE